MIAGILVLTLILTLQRFRNNLLSSEGYLTMTLPVSTDNLILSKLFVASIWTVASLIVVTVSIMIMAMSGISFRDLFEQIRGAFVRAALPAPQWIVCSVEFLIFIALSLFSGILLLYACMSLSMLVNRRRGLFTFGAFIVITTAMQTISAVLIAIAAAVHLSDWFNLSFITIFGQIQALILTVLLAEAILCVVYYCITRYMLKNRLNLQ